MNCYYSATSDVNFDSILIVAFCTLILGACLTCPLMSNIFYFMYTTSSFFLLLIFEFNLDLQESQKMSQFYHS